jgi:hypothetical protein
MKQRSVKKSGQMAARAAGRPLANSIPLKVRQPGRPILRRDDNHAYLPYYHSILAAVCVCVCRVNAAWPGSSMYIGLLPSRTLLGPGGGEGRGILAWKLNSHEDPRTEMTFTKIRPKKVIILPRLLL